ncbi:hypothetical protein GGS24DRAFT_275244 [Hypoxylon argillaceum]|nr:hypothetical protein GGS24DRAFT_275244 [Hypoxylon argillaceum]
MRHAKRCTLEPTPSVRQKACRSCIIAKARCDLQRPTCSRCSTRNVQCVYARPVRTVGCQEPAPTAATGNSGSANSGLGSGYAPAAPQPSLLHAGGAVAIVDADRDVAAYLDCGAEFAALPGSEEEIQCSLLPDLFTSSGPAAIADATSGFEVVYSTSCSTPSTHAAPNTHSHHSASSYAESLDPQLGLDSSSSPAIDDDLCVIQQAANFGVVRSVANSGLTNTSSDVGEIEPWMLALAAKPIPPDPPCLVEHSVQTLFRALRSWPRMLAKGIQLPPIIHLTQFYHDSGGDNGGDVEIPKHIARCITLCKMWVGQAEDSGQIVQDATRGELGSILAKYHTYDAPTLLAAMQSLAILLVILLFPSNRQGFLPVVPDELFAAVQEMANHVLSTGMLLHEEATHVRPPWRVWAHIEAKRRSLMSIYFVHWAYSAHHGTRHFNCLQLGRMLTPGAKWLWQAADEKLWMGLYARWLAQWDGRELIQAEFFLVERGFAMPPRVEMWLEDADELGILVMTIMNASQRDLSGIHCAEGNIVG